MPNSCSQDCLVCCSSTNFRAVWLPDGSILTRQRRQGSATLNRSEFPAFASTTDHSVPLIDHRHSRKATGDGRKRSCESTRLRHLIGSVCLPVSEGKTGDTSNATEPSILWKQCHLLLCFVSSGSFKKLFRRR
jgi:hypothetical protein